VSGYICTSNACIDNRKKNLLSSNISSTCPHNMVNFGPLAAEIVSLIWGNPANFNGFHVLAALLYGTLVVDVSQTLRRRTEGATYIRQGDHHVEHWPTFLVTINIRLINYKAKFCPHNSHSRSLTKQPNLKVMIIQSRRLSVFGHIASMDDDADAKMILTAPPQDNWKRPPGRPHITWLNTIQCTLRAYNLTLNEAVDLAQNHPLWRLMSTYGTTHS